MKKKKFRFQWGAFLMFLLFGGLFFLLLGRMLVIQFTGEAGGKALAALAEARYAKESILKAERGKILDRNGEILVSDTLSYKIIAVTRESASKGSKVPRHVLDTGQTAEVLSEFLSMDKEDIQTRLDQAKEKDLYQIEFGKAGRDISHETVQKIKEHELPGLVFFEDNKRFYPNGVFASYLIGFAVKEEEEAGTFKTVGKMGI
jgi:penicillin-binding protein 2B